MPEKGAEGVIIAQGANIGGWSLYAKGGKLRYCYNWGGFKHFMVEGTRPIPAGDQQVRMEFAYTGPGLGKGGKVTLYTDGKKVGEGRSRRRWRTSSLPTTAAMSSRTPARRSLPTTGLTVTRSTAGSRAYSSRSPRLLRAPITWLTLRLPFASPWRAVAPILGQRNGPRRRQTLACRSATVPQPRGSFEGATPCLTPPGWNGLGNTTRYSARSSPWPSGSVSTARRVAKHPGTRMETGRHGANDDQRDDER